MKTFKEHLSEHSGVFSRQWMDQDTIPSAATAIEALNSLIGQLAEQEFLNPQVGIDQLESGLGDDIQPAASLGNLKNSTCPSPKRILLRYWPLTVCQRYLGSSFVRFGCHVQSP